MAGKDERVGQRNFIWNMVGSIAYAALSVILLMIVTRTVGEEQAGIFSIAFTTGQLMLTLGLYNMHPFQATDIRGEYSFQDYFTTRCVTCAAMITASLIYIMLSGYTYEKALIVFLLCVYKMLDGLSDVFEAQFQQQNRLYIAGKALAFRSILSGTVFSLVIIATKNLVVSCIALVIAGLIGWLVFEVTVAKDFFRVGFSKARANVTRLLWVCLPLCISNFMSNYVVNSPKYSIDRLMTENHQAYYGMIFMPAYAINLCSGFVFRPLLTTMAKQWEERRHRAFCKMVLKLSFMIVLITLAALAFGWVFGIPLLSWFYATDLSSYQWPLMIILLGGGISAINVLIFYALTVMRCQRQAFWGYLVTFAFSWILPPFMVEHYGILGAAITYACLILVLDISFLTLFLTSYRKCVKMSKEIEKAGNCDD